MKKITILLLTILLSSCGEKKKQTERIKEVKAFEVERVQDWVNQAIESGGKLICGGRKISESCYEPTVLLNPADDALVSISEIFGPVVCIYTFSDRNIAIKKANSLKWAFQASVFT